MKDKHLEKIKAEMLFKPLNSKQELKDWVYLYLDMLLPDGHVYPTSNSSPAEAAWVIYDLYKSGNSKNCPVITLLASRDSFKCQRKGTLLLTKTGYKKIEDIKIDDVVWSGWNWRSVTHWIDDGYKESIEITLNNGLKICGTPIHRYWCLREGKSQWIKSSDIDKNDLICINTDTGLSNSNLVKNKDEFNIGYFLGLLSGDGNTSSIESKTHKHFSFTTIDPVMKNWYIDFCKNRWPNAKIFNGSDSTSCVIQDTNAINDITKLGIKNARSWEKEIPEYCYQSHSAMVGFISGLFDTDGTFNSKNQIEIPITANKLLTELQSVLIGYGIDARLYSNNKIHSHKKTGGCKQNHIVNKLYINGNESHKLYDLGFKTQASKANSQYDPQIYDAHDKIPFVHVQDFLDRCAIVKNTTRNRQFYKPNISYQKCHGRARYSGLTYGKLKELYNWYLESISLGYFNDQIDERLVQKIKEILSNKWFSVKETLKSKEHFFDLTVDKDHSYWSNGVISHNTIIASVIEVLCLLHFKIPIVHGAALKEQSGKCFEYVNGFFRKIAPYMEHNGWMKKSESKTRIEWIANDGDLVYIVIIAATKQATNGFHVPMLVLDEIDLMKADAYEEAKMIPSVYKGHYPLTIYLSTRKFAGGLMEKTITMTEKVGQLLRWNIVDITEKMDESILRRSEPLVKRYLSIKPPLVNISEEAYLLLPEEKRTHLEPFLAYAGIAEHQLLSVIRHYTADRPESDKGFLYKPTQAVLNNFRSLAPEMADAQLICNRPSGTNLVYSRFSEVENVISLEEAFDRLGKSHEVNKSQEMLRWLLKDLGVMIVGGADFGWTDPTSIVTLAVFPNGEVWLIDIYVSKNMEIPDIVMKMKEFDVQWEVSRWYVDQNYPAYIKELRKVGLKVPDFKKVVADGLSSVQMKIVDGSNNRKFLVLNIPQNHQVIEAFGTYKWDTDSQGDIIDGQPYHGKDGVSDIMDSIRYPFQNLFAKGGMHPVMETTALTSKSREKTAQEINSELIYGPYKQYITTKEDDTAQKKRKRIMF